MVQVHCGEDPDLWRFFLSGAEITDDIKHYSLHVGQGSEPDHLYMEMEGGAVLVLPCEEIDEPILQYDEAVTLAEWEGKRPWM